MAGNVHIRQPGLGLVHNTVPQAGACSLRDFGRGRRLMDKRINPAPGMNLPPPVEQTRNEVSTSDGHGLRVARNVTLKGSLLFLVVNLVFAWIYPVEALGRFSAYNHVFPGRVRLPYGDHPDQAYNLSVYNLEAMFASHQISAGLKPEGEYRIFLIGDSSTWGFLLPAEQTLSELMNHAEPTLADGRKVQVFNLGYPVMSLTKDLLILSYSLRYQPDLIIWLVTLESFPKDKQLFPPLLQNNPEPVVSLIETYQLGLDPEDPSFKWPHFWERTLVGARRSLADLFRLQLYGLLWLATGIDQEIPISFIPRQDDLSAELSFHNLNPPDLNEVDLSIDVITAGVVMAHPIPIWIVNEPMFVSQGINSDIRYNFYYPQWAYDDYRAIMNEKSAQENWRYIDLWDSIPSSEFTNSAVHLSPSGSRQLATILLNKITKILGISNGT